MHHKLPKHMGGDNNPNNLIELSIEEHAVAHKVLFEQHGKEEDRIAWLALSGQISKKEALLLSRKLGRELTNQKLKEKYGDNWRSILSSLGNAKGIAACKKYGTGMFDPAIRQKGMKAALSKTARANRKITFQTIGHQQGEKNSNFGKCWIHSPQQEKSILIPRDQLSLYITNGWCQGRKFYSSVV